MKALLCIAMMVIATNVFAESAQILVDGSRPTEHVTLRSAVSHTQYWTETEYTTCWRNSYTGWGSSCTTEWACRPLPSGGESCRSREVCPGYWPDYYRSESYPCTREVTRSAEVWDYDTVADITVHAEKAPAGILLHELMSVSLTGEMVNLSADRTSQQFLIFQRTNTRVSAVSSGMKHLTVDVYLRFMDRAIALAPLSGGMQNLSANPNEVSFTIGSSGGVSPMKIPLQVSLMIKKQRMLFGGKVLIERQLQASEYQASTQGNRTLIRVDLGRLGLTQQFDRNSNYTVEATAVLDLMTAGLVNTNDLPSLKMSQKIKFKNR